MIIGNININIFLVAISLVGCASTVSNSALDVAMIQAGLAAASQAKVYAVEKYARTGVWADNNAAAGYDAQMTGSTTVTIGAGGVVTISYNQGVGSQIFLTPHEREGGQIDWSCVSHGISLRTLPEGCM